MSDQYQTSMITTLAEDTLLNATVLLPGVRVWNQYTGRLHIGDGATPGGKKFITLGEIVPAAKLEIATTAGRKVIIERSGGGTLGQIDQSNAGIAGGSFAGTATAGAPRLHFGTLAPSNDDACIAVGRNVTGQSLFSHAIRDESEFQSNLDSAYTSFDAVPMYKTNTGAKYNHGYGYQWRATMAATNGMDAFSGHTTFPIVSAGTVDRLFHNWVQGTTITGGGAVTQNHGYHVSPLPGSSFAFYSEANPSALLGALQIAGALTGVTTIAASSQIDGQCGNFTGGAVSYSAGGGLLIQGTGGAAGYRTIFSYGDGSGANAGLSIRSNNILLGGTVPASGTAVEVNGVLSPAADNTHNLGTASFRFATIYAGTATINTSDERLKTDIEDVPDEWLDAWGTVEWQRYKFLDGKRWHVGLIAQRVHAAFKAQGLDAFEIGLCCFDEWDEQFIDEHRTETKVRVVRTLVKARYPDGTPKLDSALSEYYEEQERLEMYEENVPTGNKIRTVEAGDRWGLRYTECFAMEAAWTRRELKRLRA